MTPASGACDSSAPTQSIKHALACFALISATLSTSTRILLHIERDEALADSSWIRRRCTLVVPLAQLHPGQPALQAGTARWIVVLPSARSRRPFQAMTAGPSYGHVIVPNGKSAVEVESSPCPATPRPAPAPASSPPPRARRTAAPTPASCAACLCAARPPFAAPTAPAAPSTAPARLGRGSREHARARSARSRRSCASQGA